MSPALSFPKHLLVAAAAAFWLAAEARVFAAEPSSVAPHPVPWEFASARYEATVGGKPVPVFFATMNLHFASFDFTGTVEVKVRINEEDYNRLDGSALPKASEFWKGAAVVRPLSRGVKAVTKERDVAFSIVEPGQYAIERPGARGHADEVLFLFANAPETNRPKKDDPQVVWLGPGVHQRSVALTSGQTLYLEPGAVLFGPIDVWDAKDVRIRGRGAVVYYGPTSRNADTSWLNKKGCHALTTRNVARLEVEGVAFVARSRGWTIQLCKTWDATFDNVKVLNATPENLNGDGIDWFDGGRAKIRDSFFRTADDCFAFYAADASPAMRSDRGGGGHLPGAPPPIKLVEGEVRDVEIERCVLWPSIANVVRAGWVNQSLKTRNVSLRDCDVIHMARHRWMGADDGLFSAVSPDGTEACSHEGYTFDDVRLEDGGSLLAVNWPAARLKDFKFKDLQFLAPPGGGLLRAGADGLSFENVRVAGAPAAKAADLRLTFEGAIDGVRFSPAPK